MDSTANNKFILPDGFNYSCVEGCGLCCQDWNIDINPETYENLSGINWVEISDKFSGRKIFLESETGGKRFENVENKCIFLDADNSCIIHKHLGYDAKSLTCKRYPLNFMKTPAGINVRLSFVCPSIIKNTGKPLNELIEYIEYVFRAAESKYYSLSEPVFLDEDTSVSWDEYTRIEAALIKTLDSQGNYEDALRAGAKLLRYISSAKNNGLEVSDILKSAGEKSFFEARAETNLIKRRLYLSIFATNELVGQSKKTALQRYLSAFNILLGRGSISIKGTEADISKANKIKFNIENGNVSGQIKRYIRHLISTKWYLIPVVKLNPQGTNLKSGYSFILIIYALIRWYSKIFAAQRGGDEVGQDDIEKAISAVEKNYAGHVSRDTLFLNNKRFAQISNILIMQEYFEETII